MFDTENLSDENELVGQESTDESMQESTPSEDTATETAELVHPKNDRAQSGDMERNMRALREKATRAERERDEIANRLRGYETRANPVAPEEDLSLNLGESDLAEGRHVQKLDKKIDRQARDNQKTQAELKQLLLDTRLQIEHPDIFSVVTDDNYKTLVELYPEVGATLGASNDYYNKAKTAYTMIKKFGIIKEDNYVAERETIAKNAAKPRPLTSLSPQQGESALSKVNVFDKGLTPDLMKQLRKEMEEATRNR